MALTSNALNLPKCKIHKIQTAAMAHVTNTPCVTLRKEKPNLIGSLWFLHCHTPPDVCELSIQGPDALVRYHFCALCASVHMKTPFLLENAYPTARCTHACMLGKNNIP